MEWVGSVTVVCGASPLPLAYSHDLDSFQFPKREILTRQHTETSQTVVSSRRSLWQQIGEESRMGVMVRVCNIHAFTVQTRKFAGGI